MKMYTTPLYFKETSSNIEFWQGVLELEKFDNSIIYKGIFNKDHFRAKPLNEREIFENLTAIEVVSQFSNNVAKNISYINDRVFELCPDLNKYDCGLSNTKDTPKYEKFSSDSLKEVFKNEGSLFLRPSTKEGVLIFTDGLSAFTEFGFSLNTSILHHLIGCLPNKGKTYSGLITSDITKYPGEIFRILTSKNNSLFPYLKLTLLDVNQDSDFSTRQRGLKKEGSKLGIEVAEFLEVLDFNHLLEILEVLRLTKVDNVDLYSDDFKRTFCIDYKTREEIFNSIVGVV